MCGRQLLPLTGSSSHAPPTTSTPADFVVAIETYSPSCPPNSRFILLYAPVCSTSSNLRHRSLAARPWLRESQVFLDCPRPDLLLLRTGPVKAKSLIEGLSRSTAIPLTMLQKVQHHLEAKASQSQEQRHLVFDQGSLPPAGSHMAAP